jgi:hypothetical protein
VPAYRDILEIEKAVNNHENSITILEAAPIWTEVTSFSNSWVNYGGTEETAGYCKDVLGFVHLKGLIKNGTLTTTCFRLPASMYPAKDKTFPVSSYGAFGNCYVHTDGYVIPNVGDNRSFSLDGITFYVG